MKNDEVFQRVDDMGVVIATPFLWKTSLHEKEPVSNGFVFPPVYYMGNVLISTTNGDKNVNKFTLIDTDIGKTIWSWDDQFEPKFSDLYIRFYHQYNNILTFQWGSWSYGINLDNGTSKWREKRDRSFDVRIGSFDKYFFSYAEVINSDGYNEFIAFKGDMQTGVLSEFLKANLAFEHPDCVRGIYHVTQVPNQKNLLVVTYCENLPDWVTQPYFGLYDTETYEWIWDKILILPPKPSNGLYYEPIIVNNKIYGAISTSIVCHDLETGKQLWKREFNGNFESAGIILEEGKVIANCEDTYAYALEAETGNILWSVKTAGTCSRMSYLNGVVYMVGGSGGGRLFAIEASTGKMLWRIDAGLLGEGEGARFRTNAVYVLPAKDDQPAKVIALSDMYAYCFEAER
ncbi:MAG: PQQ-like beta-propeller repeat protein [Marinilabiliaceae bacterium]|nr:PQQ-like beta-propeller repeat protein [Marinilabiliaceae bacterium]